MIKEKIQFYRTLSTLESAGVPLLQALEQPQQGPLRKVTRQLRQILQTEGLSLSEAFTRFPRRIFPELEINLVSVAERTGRLDVVFAHLADWLEFRQRLAKRLLTSMLYPAFLYHPAVAAGAGVPVLTGQLDPAEGLTRAALMLGIPYALTATVLATKVSGISAPGPVAKFLGHFALTIPFAGTIVYRLNHARFYRALALALETGEGAPAAVALAGETCRNNAVRAKFRRIADTMKQEGCPFSEAFGHHATSRDRNSLAMTMLKTGETSGGLPALAAKAAEYYEEESEEGLKRIAVILPLVVYLAVAGFIVYQIVSFYHNLYGDIMNF